MTTLPPSSPPPSAPPSAGPQRPGVVVAAVALSMVSALLFLIEALLTMLDTNGIMGGPFNFYSVLYGIPELLLAVAAVVFGLVALGGSDFGKSFTAGIGGAGLCYGAIGLFNIIGTMVDPGSHTGAFAAIEIPSLLNGPVGLGIMLALSSPAVSRWLVAKRTPAPGFPPGAPMGMPGGAVPSAPGQPMPPAAPPAAPASPVGQPNPYVSDAPPAPPGGQPNPSNDPKP